ncbi:MAG: hypothetical protein K0R55_2384 [Sporomusa sp.]|nr:hypothetical protein [Sporomusa sp.]
MEKVCPLCNAMKSVYEKCPYCGQTMIDGGSISYYLGPYSPYMEIDSLAFNSEEICVHLIYCPVCDYDVRVGQMLVTI